LDLPSSIDKNKRHADKAGGQNDDADVEHGDRCIDPSTSMDRLHYSPHKSVGARNDVQACKQFAAIIAQ
jgi:hypothetical protein